MEALNVTSRCQVQSFLDLSASVPSTSSVSSASPCPRLSSFSKFKAIAVLGQGHVAHANCRRAHLCNPIAAAAVEDAEVELAGEPGGDPEEYVGDDSLVIYFKAEGFVSDMAAPKVTEALEGVEGVSNVRIEATDGGATVECMQATTVQATGVTSHLVEVIQAAGFQLQTLSLGFDDEAEADPNFFSFGNAKFNEDNNPPPSAAN